MVQNTSCKILHESWVYRVIYVKLYRIFLCNYASICRWYDGIISCTHRCEIQNLSVVSHSQDFPEAPPLPAAQHWPWHFQPKPQPILPYPSVRHSLKALPKVATPEERKPFESGQWRYTSDHIRFIQFLPQNSNAIFSRPVTAVTKFIRPIETTTRIGRKNTTKKGCSRWAAAAQVVGFIKECQRHSFLEIYARAQITSI